MNIVQTLFVKRIPPRCTMLLLVFCLIAASLVPALGQPRLINLTPATNANNVARDSRIQMDLTVSLQAASINDQSIRVFGSQSGFRSTKGTIDIVSGSDARFRPDGLDYYPGERIYVTITNANDIGAKTMERPWSFFFDVAAEPARAEFPNRSNYNAVLSNSQWGATADMDGDGDLDICQVHQSVGRVAVMLNNGSGAFSLDADYPTLSSAGALALGDFDGDGDVDVVTCTPISNEVSVLFNNGAAVLSAGTDYSVDRTPQKVEVADVNGDGHLDIISANTNGDNVSVLFNNGSGVFAAAVDYNSGDGCVAVRAGDVNNDGFLDLLTVNLVDENLAVLLNNGDGTFAAPVTRATKRPQELYLGDLDGDGDLDAVVCFLDDDEIGVLLNDGTGSFAAAVEYAAGARPKSATMADLDGDGDLDVAVSNRNIPFTMSVFYNNGNAVLTEDAKYDALGPECVMHGDFDGDGDVDLATANETAFGNQLSVFRNADVPTKLNIASLNPLSPNSGQSIALAVNTVRNNGTVANVTTNTQITASFSDADLGLSGGALSGTISANSHTLNFAITNATLTPVAVPLTITATSGMSLTATSTTITIGPNQAPTISTSQTVVSTLEDVARTLAVDVNDTESPLSALVLSASSNNPGLIPDANITQQGSTTAISVFNIQPLANANGIADISIAVSDGLQTRSVTFAVTVAAVNDPPQIATSDLDVCFDEDTSTSVTVSISDIDTATPNLQVFGSSADQTLIPDVNIIQQGATAALVTLQVSSAPDQNGSTTVTLSVFDGEFTRSTTIAVTVKSVNDPPFISTSHTAICFDEDASTILSINISDMESATSALQITATSDEQSLIANAEIVQQGGTTAISQLLLTPAANANGLAAITVFVSDGEFTSSTVFSVTVKPVNDPPTISTMADLALLFNGVAINGFGIGDIDTPITSLQVSASSANQSLFADGSIEFSVTSASMTVEFAAECDQTGAALLTVTVSDGSLSSSATFMAEVAASTTAVVITGASLACPASVISYNVPADAAAASHDWSAVGGEIISGQGKNAVEVVWSSGVADRLTVVRNYPNGCTSADVLLLNPQSLTTQLDFVVLNSSSTSISVLGNDSAGLTLLSVSGSSNGTASMNGSSVEFTPNAGFSGMEHLTYRVQNAAGCVADGSVLITVPAMFNNAINLNFVERQKDREGSVRGLRKALNSAISPDGNHVYAAGRNDHSIAVFSRDQNDGTLTYRSRARNGHHGVLGLKYVSDVIVSPDGKHVYAAGFGDNSVVVFERNPSTGVLTFVERKKNGHFEGAQKITGIKGLRMLRISSDGRSVYVAGTGNNSLVLFQRSPFSGRLTYLARYKDGAGGIDGLRGVLGLASSSDGRSVYASGAGEDKLAVFSRDLTTGALSYVERLRDDVGGIDGLNGATAVAVSPDGNHVYVAGKSDDAVAVFERNAHTSRLTFVAAYNNNQSGISGLDGVCGIAVSPDGRHVWATSSIEHALAVFKRNSASGELTFLGAVSDGIGGVDGLAGAMAATLNNSSSDVYVSGSADNAVAQIFRNVAPTAADDAVGAAIANSTLTISPLTNDSDPDGHALQITTKTNGALGTVSIAGGGTTLQYAAGTIAGADSFTYTIEDAHGGSSTATVNLTVALPKSGREVFADQLQSNLTVSPNPASKQTEVGFGLEQPASVILTLSDLRGAQLFTLDLGSLNAGEHARKVELCDASGLVLPRGVYILQLEQRDRQGNVKADMRQLQVR